MPFIGGNGQQARVLALLAILAWAHPSPSFAEAVSENVTKAPPPGGRLSTRTENGKIVFVHNIETSNDGHQRIGVFVYTLQNCASGGFPRVIIKTSPHNGTITVEQAISPAHPSHDPCTAKDQPGTGVYYTASPGYVGAENIKLDVVFPDGGDRLMEYDLTVTDKK